jgi:tetratricopeptide (TPR) repeat protein
MNDKNVKELYKKANKYNTNNKYELAIECYNKVLDLDKNNLKTLKELGELYEKLNKITNAIICYEKILAITPKSDIQTTVIYLNQIGVCYNNLRKYETAIIYFKKILLIKNDIPDVYNNIYSCHFSLKQYKLAEINLLISFKINPNEKIIENLGFLYNCLKEYDKSIFYYNKLCDYDNNNHSIKYALSFIYLAKKNFKYGYELHENRLKNNNISPITGEKERVDIPFISYWDGKEPCNSLLVVYEQGIGDNIQYYRFIIQLSQLYPNMKVTYFCKDIVSHIFKEYTNIKVVQNIENIFAYNYKAYIMSLPHLLKVEMIRPVTENYINVDEEKVVYWGKQLKIRNPENKLNVGFFYKGLLNVHIEKSIPLESFIMLSNLNINLICLHRTVDIVEDLKTVTFKEKIITFDIDKDKSFVDTIAILKNIDILITVDTSIAHLAGVLNVKTLLLLGYISEWRWFNNNEKIWYDSVDLLRMTENSELKNILPQVKNILTNMKK